MCGSGSRICKTSYRCRLYVIIPSYQASSFATGRGSPYCFRCRPTSTHITKARRPLSLILGVGTIIAIPGSLLRPQGFSGCLHQQSLQLLLIFYLLLATEEIRTPSIITFANDATLSIVAVLLSEPTQPLFTTPMARRILQFACYKEPSVLLDSSRALSLKRILGQYIHWYYCC